MYENAFEKLRAAANYGTRGIAQQMNLLQSEGIPREEIEPYRLYLLKPENYLFDELMTTRGANYEPWAEQDQKKYEALVKKLLNVKIVPIGVHAAHGWYAGVRAALGDAGQETKTAIKKAIAEAGKEDPWLMQGAAVLCTRAGMVAETDCPEHAPKLWDAALDWWNRFLAIADATSSAYYSAERDAKKREVCAAAWGDFRTRLLAQIKTRCFSYIEQNNGAAANACLETLRQSGVRLLDAKIYDETLREASAKIAMRMRGCPTLTEADALYAGLGAQLKTSPSIVSAVLSKMADEVLRIDKDLGSIESLEAAWQAIHGSALRDSGDIGTAPALKAYFGAVSALSSRVVNDTDEQRKKRYIDAVAALLRQLPSDHVVGRTATEAVTAADLLGSIGFREITKLLDKFVDGNPREAVTLRHYRELKAFADANPHNAAFHKAYGVVRINKVIECANVLGEGRNANAETLGLSICADLPQDTTFPSGTSSIGIAEVERLLKAEKPPEIGALEIFAACDPCDAKAMDKLGHLRQTAALKDTYGNDYMDLYVEVLKQKLIASVNAWGEKHDGSAQRLGMAIAKELQKVAPRTTFPMGSTQITISHVLALLGDMPISPVPDPIRIAKRSGGFPIGTLLKHVVWLLLFVGGGLLLSTWLCRIDPMIPSGWLRGLWHGANYVPNLIWSLIDGRLTAAPVHSGAYSVFWWIFTITSCISWAYWLLKWAGTTVKEIKK